MYISQQFKECLYVKIYSIYIYVCVVVILYIYILYSVYHAGTKTPHLLTSSHIAHVFFQINRPNYAHIFSINHFLSQKKTRRTTLKQHLGGIRRFSLTHRQVPTPGSLPIILSSCISWDAKDVIIKLAPRKLIALRSSTWRRLKLLSEDSRTRKDGTKNWCRCWCWC